MKQERILVVDDEAIVRETIKNDLMEAGYDVVEARNGMEGVRQFNNGAIDLVISDLVMGEMDGLEVLKEVKKISPDTPVI
ncbi:MAG: response regulator, partial [Nitrospinae bacterium]|nr:response regulator [Nitrospinota bacterium]